MTTTQEKQEMREELEEALKRAHPMMLFKQALAEGDREVAELVLEVGRDKLTGCERLSLSQSLKASFPETVEQWKARQDAAGAEQRSAVGDSLAARNSRRREQAQKIAAHSKAYAGEHVPRREGVEYAEPDAGGFNTALGMGRSEQRSLKKIRSLYNRPESDAS